MTDQRQKIIASVFSRRNADGNLEETYVSHVKIWEDAGPEGGGRKPRYILLSQAINGTGFIHKSKLNTNGTFSVGKTWRLVELRGIQVSNPLAFNFTLSRTYRWQTESREDQASFLEATVRLFRTITGGQAPLQLDGVPDYDPSADVQGATTNSRRSNRSPSPPPTRAPPPPPRAPRSLPQTSPEAPRIPSPALSRSAAAGSPSNGDRERSRPPMPLSVPSPAAPLPARRPPPGPNGSSNRVASGASDVNSRNGSNTLQVEQPQISRATSPTPSTRSRNAPSRAENMSGALNDNGGRKDQNARISYFDPSNQAALERLILGVEQTDTEGEEENAQATLANVEEMIEGYEWASDDIMGRKMTRGAVDMIEARLMDELMALEKANIHSFLESDDRVGAVMKYMDEAIAELDNMETLISTYKIHLNAVGDDIVFIQSQNRGLQVQNQNQRALLAELQNLLRTVHVDQEALITLTQGSLENTQSIDRLEEAAVQLYKALQAGRDTEMAATMERLQEYRTYNTQFAKRMLDFLSIMFVAQSKILLGDGDGIKKIGNQRLFAVPHNELEDYLGRYSGLMLYMREMDESIYSKICATYFSASSDLFSVQMKALLSAYQDLVKKAPDEEIDTGFGTVTSPLTARGTAGMRRAGTIMRAPMEGRNRDKDRQAEGQLRASEAFGYSLEQVANLIYQEHSFLSDFLQINDSAITYADYMNLDNYFRRQAARSSAISQATMKLLRNSLDLIFGFLPAELKAWLDAALAKDQMEIVGILSFLEKFLVEADEKGNPFVMTLLEKQHSRLKLIFERHISDQLKNIERTKLSSKKRRGVTQFVKYFSAYSARLENQLLGADNLEIRTSVDFAYEKITQAMFDSLKQIAKLEGEGEDKGQLNYHVILIENMHYFIAEISQMNVPSLIASTRRAQAIYDENLAAYIKIVFRRPFAKIIDFFEGLDRVTKNGSTSEIASNSNFNKSALKKIIKDFTAKDMRKSIDILAKRVEKHFTEEKSATDDHAGVSAGVLVEVWTACEEELVRLTETWSSRISQWYSDSGASLDFTKMDVESVFRRQKFGA